MSGYTLVIFTLFILMGIAGATSAKKATPYAEIPSGTRRLLQFSGVLVVVLSLVGIAFLLFLAPVPR